MSSKEMEESFDKLLDKISRPIGRAEAPSWRSTVPIDDAGIIIDPPKRSILASPSVDLSLYEPVSIEGVMGTAVISGIYVNRNGQVAYQVNDELKFYKREQIVLHPTATSPSGGHVMRFTD